MPRAYKKTQVYLPPEDLEELARIAARADRSVASLVREAITRTWLAPRGRGPVAIWEGPAGRTSADHDSVWDER